MQGIWDYKYQYRFDLRTPQPNAASMGREFATSDPVGCSPSFRLPPHLRGRYRTLQIAGSGKSDSINEELSVSFFSTLIDRLAEAGYLHYEISNFARPGFFSKHNSSYWTGKKYLGLGPSAHSYNGIDREWNPSSLPIYIDGIENGHPTIESEDLDLCTRYNDFIITGLRTMWGVSFADIQTKFGRKLLSYCQKQAQPHINQGLLLQTGDKLILSKSGIFVSDGIMSDLLWV